MSPFINSLEEKILFVINQKESNEEGDTKMTKQRKGKKKKKPKTRGKKILIQKDNASFPGLLQAVETVMFHRQNKHYFNDPDFHQQKEGDL